MSHWAAYVTRCTRCGESCTIRATSSASYARKLACLGWRADHGDDTGAGAYICPECCEGMDDALEAMET